MPLDSGDVGMVRFGWLVFGVGVVLLCRSGREGRAQADAPAPVAVEYNRDVRPILADKCFRCHGPRRREAQGRLAARSPRRGARRARRPARDRSRRSGRERARLPGERRGRGAADAAARFGPGPAAARDRAARGAGSSRVRSISRTGHSSLLSRRRCPPWAEAEASGRGTRSTSSSWPSSSSGGWSRRPRKAGRSCCGGVSLDLTGLPPTPGELDACAVDRSPGAYERAVDRLLASPRYGERMALDWLDAARYADTNGYYTDLERHAWPWRDWVIRALNGNMPFDRFTIEQLAGDLLPGATDDQKIATGFNRNHMVTNESGVDRRGVSRRVRGRPGGYDGHRLAGADRRLCPLPRSQVRPDHAEGVLRTLRLLQQRAGEGTGQGPGQPDPRPLPADRRARQAAGRPARPPGPLRRPVEGTRAGLERGDGRMGKDRRRRASRGAAGRRGRFRSEPRWCGPGAGSTRGEHRRKPEFRPRRARDRPRYSTALNTSSSKAPRPWTRTRRSRWPSGSSRAAPRAAASSRRWTAPHRPVGSR